jgi:hypothetical protein
VGALRAVSRRDATGEFFTRLLTQADDVADALEEAAFLLTLLAPGARDTLRGHPIVQLAGSLVSAAEEWGRCVAASGRVRRGGDRCGAAAPGVGRARGRPRARVRRRTARRDGRAVPGGLDASQLLLLVSQGLEEGADALARCAQSLRDHLLGDVLPG